MRLERLRHINFRFGNGGGIRKYRRLVLLDCSVSKLTRRTALDGCGHRTPNRLRRPGRARTFAASLGYNGAGREQLRQLSTMVGKQL